MEKKLIGFGLLAGGVGGLLTFVFARIVAEPLIQRAIDYEGGRDAAQAGLDRAAGLAVAPAGEEVFSRTIQADVGIGVGLILFGMAMGALVGVAYAVCLGRTGGLRPRPLALLVAAAGYVGFFLVPFAKYPANPPAIGLEDTIRERASLYLVAVACSLIFLFLAVYAGQRLVGRLGAWNAAVVCGVGYAVVMTVLFLVMPSVSETPTALRDDAGTVVFPGFPADVLAGFRVYALASQAILWTVIGLVFAPLAERVVAPAPRRTTTPVAA